jgi:hypothetical protein
MADVSHRTYGSCYLSEGTLALIISVPPGTCCLWVAYRHDLSSSSATAEMETGWPGHRRDCQMVDYVTSLLGGGFAPHDRTCEMIAGRNGDQSATAQVRRIGI